MLIYILIRINSKYKQALAIFLNVQKIIHLFVLSFLKINFYLFFLKLRWILWEEMIDTKC